VTSAVALASGFDVFLAVVFAGALAAGLRVAIDFSKDVRTAHRNLYTALPQTAC
jgi:hypothetical protein